MSDTELIEHFNSADSGGNRERIEYETTDNPRNGRRKAVNVG